MTVEGVDYSFGRPGGAALAAAGKKFAVRYVPYPGDGGKGLTAAELADLQAHGVAVVLVFESVAGRARGGHDAGVADGQTALRAKTALHIDADRPVYFAVDFNTTPNDYPTIDAYLRGAALALGPACVGVYGEAALMDKVKSLGSARWFWQTYAWSAGAVSDAAHILQYSNGHSLNGAAVDYDRAFTQDYGQTPRPGSTSGTTSQPPEYTVDVADRDGRGRHTSLYAQKGAKAPVAQVSTGTYTCTRQRYAGAWWYHILGPARSDNVGRWMKAEPWWTVS